MAYTYTRSHARGEVADSDIEPSDSSTSPLSISVRPSVETVEGLESVSCSQMSTSLATGISAYFKV